MDRLGREGWSSAASSYDTPPLEMDLVTHRLSGGLTTPQGRTKASRPMDQRLGGRLSRASTRCAGVRVYRRAYCGRPFVGWAYRPAVAGRLSIRAFEQVSDLHQVLLERMVHSAQLLRYEVAHEAIVVAASTAWNWLTAEAGHITSLCTYPWIAKLLGGSCPKRWCKSAGHGLSSMKARAVGQAAAMRLGLALGSSLSPSSVSRLM